MKDSKIRGKSNVKVNAKANAKKSAKKSTTKPLQKSEASTARHVSSLRAHVLRLTPGQDLYSELTRYARETKASYAVGTCVGSLTEVFMRMPGASVATRFSGPFEIVSLVGTLTADGVHLHIAVSDREARAIGGHLKEKSLIHTTAEIVLFEILDLQLCRRLDSKTGYPELVIQKLNPK